MASYLALAAKLEAQKGQATEAAAAGLEALAPLVKLDSTIPVSWVEAGTGCK